MEAQAGMGWTSPCSGVVEERDDGWNLRVGDLCMRKTGNWVQAVRCVRHGKLCVVEERHGSQLERCEAYTIRRTLPLPIVSFH